MSSATGAMVMVPALGSVMTATGCDRVSLPKIRSLTPKMLLDGTASLSRPLLAPSQLSFRIGLARTRMSSYPCDSMDFVMMDLERPDNRSRQAHWCNGDLTGRLLEFLCCSEGVDGKNDPRLDELFERILNQKQPSGYIGRLAASPTNGKPEEDPAWSGIASKHFTGLLRYYELTGNARALDAAKGMAEVLWSVRDVWKKNKIVGATEPLAWLYGITKDSRWLELCGMIRDNISPLEGREMNSHALLSPLRGLQIMTLVTGDPSWNLLPDQNQKIIIDNHLEMPDGNIPEKFPSSSRNEGCSISDWMMLNLNQGLINGDEDSYDKAERILWNALAFNQFITGGFGHRRIVSNGYGVDSIQEAWWCCTQNAGMGMSDFARHSVTFRNNTINVNFLTPGEFELPLPGDKWAKIKIQTQYPAKAEAKITVENVSEDVQLKIRVPSFIRNPNIDQIRSSRKIEATFKGQLGHRIEQTNPGVILTYGPLVLVPPKGVGVGGTSTEHTSDGTPEGYIPQSIPIGIPIIKLDNPPDTDGFVQLPLCPPARPLPTWSYFDEGPGSRTWVEGAAVEVNLKYPDGKILATRFIPMCYNTSCLALFDTPVIFQDIEY